jgi:hypothetical protein
MSSAHSEASKNASSTKARGDSLILVRLRAEDDVHILVAACVGGAPKHLLLERGEALNFVCEIHCDLFKHKEFSGLIPIANKYIYKI